MKQNDDLTASLAGSPQADGQDRCMPLDHLGLILAQGDDAASFLHNQLTNDMQSLDAHAARPAGYCSPKGRLLANFLCWKNDQGIFLQCPRDILPTVLKRLSMFVMRSKVKLSDATGSTQLHGIVGAAARAKLAPHFEVPEAVWQVAHSDAGTLMRVPDSMGLPRWQWIVSEAQPALPHIVSEITASLQNTDAALWRWLEIRAGLPSITLATQERFIPQAINFEALGGVNFKKGCYPGQEVVARSQYLGKLKRRMALAHLAAEAMADATVATPSSLPGQDIMTRAGNTDAPQAIGMVVNAESAPSGGIDLLIEIPVMQMEGERFAETLTVQDIDMPLEKIALPYVLPDQDIFVRPKL